MSLRVLIAGAGLGGLTLAHGLRQAGLNVDLQSMDWSTETTRRTKKDPPEQGGWNIFTTWQSGYPMTSPITSFPLVTTCDQKNWFGWPCDEAIEKLRASFISAGTLDEQKKIAEAIQKRYYEFLPYMNTGQFFAPVAWRNTRSRLDSSAPPPVSTMPLSTMSAASSGGVCSSAILTSSMSAARAVSSPTRASSSSL